MQLATVRIDYSRIENFREQLTFNNPAATRKHELSLLKLYHCHRYLGHWYAQGFCEIAGQEASHRAQGG